MQSEARTLYKAVVGEEAKKAAPILIADLFPEVRRELLQVLNDLSPAEWERQTAAPLWSVKDVALHLLGGDASNLSRRRDAFRLPGKPIANYGELVAFLNKWNAQWVTAARRMSPRVVCDLLSFTGPQIAEYFTSLDPFAVGEPVSWAGPDPAPVWLDVAREYTEQWHHQQQIRDATARPPLYARRLFLPVLDTFMRAVPHVYRDVAAAEGTAVEIRITGDAGGAWFLSRGGQGWELLLECDSEPAASIAIPQDTAWRLFMKGLPG
ncbi:MAG: maleylpyruvate isomerase N-terminal domain-containing protein [Acidobacteriaceae bacterium]